MAAAIAAAEHGKLFSDGPKAQHPHIDLEGCIGCGTCVDACPEGDVLGVLEGHVDAVGTVATDGKAPNDLGGKEN